MTIIDSKKATDYLCKWMKDYLFAAGKKGYVIYAFPDEMAESSLLKIICEKARIPHSYEQNLQPIVQTAKETNRLIATSINRSKYRLIRDYPKYFNPDVAPLADLFRSEIAQLLRYFDSDESLKDLIKFTNIKMQASWQDLEWADREDARTKIIISTADPATNHNWSIYSIEQKRLLARMNQLEKLTRHKQNPNLPVILRQEMPGLKS